MSEKDKYISIVSEVMAEYGRRVSELAEPIPEGTACRIISGKEGISINNMTLTDIKSAFLEKLPWAIDRGLVGAQYVALVVDEFDPEGELNIVVRDKTITKPGEYLVLRGTVRVHNRGADVSLYGVAHADVNEGSAKSYNSSSVVLSGRARCTAYGKSNVFAYGDSAVRALDESSVLARESSVVFADMNATVNAEGRSVVHADGESKVWASEDSLVTCKGHSAALGITGRAIVRAMNSQKLHASPQKFGVLIADGGASLVVGPMVEVSVVSKKQPEQNG